MTEENKIEIIISDKETNPEERTESSNFIGKKRILFKIYKFKKLGIFNSGGASLRTRQIIDEILERNEEKKKIIGYWPDKKVKRIYHRKYNSDNIRKKIKVRFIKKLIHSVNKRLKLAGTRKKFRPLAQKLISTVTKEKNKAFFNLPFKDIFSKNFSEGKESVDSDLRNLNNNLSVLKYLEKNIEVSEKSNYCNFKNMTFGEIFNEYLKSNEFEMEINRLIISNENKEYISDYIIKANTLIEFFSN